MYISFNWLKDFVKLPAKTTPEQVSRALTAHTVEVEGLVSQSQQFNKVVVGDVLEVSPHPNADRLRLALVDVKTSKLRIVCGAPNLEAGQKVPVALVGAQLPNGLEIKESEIRGEKSNGMICAEDELGLGSDHEGILVLDKKAKIGQEFSQFLESNDTILEIDNKSLSNRPDLLNHYGLARELSAIFSSSLKPYEKFINDKKLNFPKSDKEGLDIKIEAKESCARYTAVKIDNVTVQESPDWLKKRIISINQRPVNNIVDLTNYVMFDCGQPLHAFDAKTFSKLVIKTASRQENFETLDGKERLLESGDLLITDGKKTLAIAGIMGGQDSEVTLETNSIILESANFSATSIRKTSQRLGLRSEASLRFEKSLDSNLTEIALKRFLSLLLDVCPEAKISTQLFDYYPNPPEGTAISLDLDWLDAKIGQKIEKDFIISSLSKLGFVCQKKSERIIDVTVPSWRGGKDISLPEDLVEEVLRLYGYDKIESRLPVLEMPLPRINRELELERKVKQALVWGQYFSETYNYSFIGENQLKKMGLDPANYLKIANPQSNLYTRLRRSLTPGLLSNVKNNQARPEELRFMEIGRVFFDVPGKEPKDNKEADFLPYQEKHLGMAVAGGENPMSKLKGIITWLTETLLGDQSEVEFISIESIPAWAEFGQSAKVNVLGREIGTISLVSSETGHKLNLKKEIALAEIIIPKLLDLTESVTAFSFQEAPKFPAVLRDLAFVVGPDLVYNDFRREILNFNPLIKRADLFDVYQGPGLSQDEKSLGFRISYRSDDKTLTASEVDSLQESLVNHLADKFSVRLRDF